jgi:hypothetical protein
MPKAIFIPDVKSMSEFTKKLAEKTSIAEKDLRGILPLESASLFELALVSEIKSNLIKGGYEPLRETIEDLVKATIEWRKEFGKRNLPSKPRISKEVFRGKLASAARKKIKVKK